MTDQQPAAPTRRHPPLWSIVLPSAAAIALGLTTALTSPGTAAHTVLIIATIIAIITTLFTVALNLLNPRLANRWHR